MLRCRRCRKGVIDSACLSMQVQDSDESSAAVCSIWHVNVDTLPEWILTSVHQAQWTVGKLNCQNCGARLGGFNFIHRSECPCGRDAAVHFSKSRVDHDHKRYVLIVQPRRTRPERFRAGLLPDGFQNKDERPEFGRTTLESLQLNCAAVMSHISPAEASNPPPDPDSTQSFSFSPLYCISHRRRCSMEEDGGGGSFRSSCFCPAGRADMTDLVRSRTDESARSLPTSLQFDSDGEAPLNVVPRRPSAPARSPQHQHTEEEATAVQEEVSDSALFLRGRSISDSVAEQQEEEEVVPPASAGPPASTRASKREKNHLKSLRRKQRRRERWLHSQLEQAEIVGGSLPDSEEEDREGLTCAVCLDVYFSPYSCQPCSHVFCEPCLRTLAKNRPTNTPCPLCRTLISHTSFHKELNHTAKTFFPKVYFARKQNFQNASCAKWPLPSFRKRFHSFWGYQRQAPTAGRRWHFAHGGFALHDLDFTDMRGWLFGIGLVVYVHSLKWILTSLLFYFFMYYFVI
ncbi:E3 ubiquitin-protein ligase RNF180 [Stegastes partitus]|uniref:E3 ubiquitin-protein ligase RNF180 n=1 Tax=Stegastes partitus TaxID=144197 RepID=A0A3B4Z8C9_9TELE|nr:PREDICTED: E3 ubiquitin-protein ligase RNF180 [Stegastes partitus]